MTAPLAPLVLVVDDEADYLAIAARLLKGAGYRILESACGLDGVAAAGKNRPGLILLDIGLPDISGLEAARRIRKLPSMSRVPILFFTVRSETNIVAEGLKIPDTGYILKPFDMQELLARVEALLA
ncbi:MAG: response regulator [Elusimicrobia bacterium]|nr:response regulator [Elusimicrobiota bacterium]